MRVLHGPVDRKSGYSKAAEYVAGELERAGLKPAGTGGYFQDVGFEVQSIQTATSRVLLVPEKAAPIDVSDDLMLSPGILQRAATQAPLVFAGYGIHLPEEGYDDFAGHPDLQLLAQPGRALLCAHHRQGDSTRLLHQRQRLGSENRSLRHPVQQAFRAFHLDSHSGFHLGQARTTYLTN